MKMPEAEAEEEAIIILKYSRGVYLRCVMLRCFLNMVKGVQITVYWSMA